MVDKEIFEDDGEGVVIEFEDENGEKSYYQEEMILPVGDEKYAILVSIDVDGEHHHEGCECGCEDEPDAFFAKVVVNDDGEEEYVDITDEEYEKVQEAYEALFDEEEDN